MIKIDENDPIGEVDPSFPFRDVVIKKNTDMKQFYDLQKEIGRGKFGTVYKCTEKSTGLKLAAKFINTSKRQDRRNAEREVELMRELQHPRLIQIYDAYEMNNTMCVVLELIEGGELFERVIDDDFVLTEKSVSVFMKQICEGVAFIHSKNILHLDMKPENILCLSRNGNRIKIIDFGLARKYDPEKKLQVLFGTPEFVAPEVVNFDSIGFGTDMWSVGVICYVLLSGLSPFMGETDMQTMANVTIAHYDFDDEAFNDISKDAKDFISKLLIKDKELRMSATECLSHYWLQRRNCIESPCNGSVSQEQINESHNDAISKNCKNNSNELEYQKDTLRNIVDRWNDEANVINISTLVDNSNKETISKPNINTTVEKRKMNGINIDKKSKLPDPNTVNTEDKTNQQEKSPVPSHVQTEAAKAENDETKSSKSRKTKKNDNDTSSAVPLKKKSSVSGKLKKTQSRNSIKKESSSLKEEHNLVSSTILSQTLNLSNNNLVSVEKEESASNAEQLSEVMDENPDPKTLVTNDISNTTNENHTQSTEKGEDKKTTTLNKIRNNPNQKQNNNMKVSPWPPADKELIHLKSSNNSQTKVNKYVKDLEKAKMEVPFINKPTNYKVPLQVDVPSISPVETTSKAKSISIINDKVNPEGNTIVENLENKLLNPATKLENKIEIITSDFNNNVKDMSESKLDTADKTPVRKSDAIEGLKVVRKINKSNSASPKIIRKTDAEHLHHSPQPENIIPSKLPINRKEKPPNKLVTNVTETVKSIFVKTSSKSTNSSSKENKESNAECKLNPIPDNKDQPNQLTTSCSKIEIRNDDISARDNTSRSVKIEVNDESYQRTKKRTFVIKNIIENNGDNSEQEKINGNTNTVDHNSLSSTSDEENENLSNVTLRRRISDITSLLSRGEYIDRSIDEVASLCNSLNQIVRLRHDNNSKSGENNISSSKRPKFRISCFSRDVPLTNTSNCHANLTNYTPVNSEDTKPSSWSFRKTNHSDPGSLRNSPERFGPPSLTRKILSKFFNESMEYDLIGVPSSSPNSMTKDKLTELIS